MAKKAVNVDVERALEKLTTTPAVPPATGGRAETRELWRVISADGSTRLFQTAPPATSATKPHTANLGPAANPTRGRLVTPLRRESGHDEQVSLADLFEAAAARKPLPAVALRIAASDGQTPAAAQAKPTQNRAEQQAEADSTRDGATSPGSSRQTDSATSAPSNPPMDADLKQTIEAWPQLSLGIRAAIVAMVRAASLQRA